MQRYSKDSGGSTHFSHTTNAIEKFKGHWFHTHIYPNHWRQHRQWRRLGALDLPGAPVHTSFPADLLAWDRQTLAACDLQV